MLEHLELTNVGPAAQLELTLGERLNLITGDNGLGKSFLLDIAWWTLTRYWPAEVNPRLSSGMMARPLYDGQASIGFSFSGKAKLETYVSEFDREEQRWGGRQGRPANPGLVLYAQVDGSFAVWDPARNYWRANGEGGEQQRRPAYVFSPKEVWDGLLDADDKPLCNGLVRDWASWQKERGQAFRQLQAVLLALSPSEDERITPGELTRISLDDARDIPTVRMPYQQDVPILFASAGLRRIVALAYLLVWAWEEHRQASKLRGTEVTSQVVFLVDEIEAHLHPRWQRLILKALLNVMRELTGEAQVQVITATHSPLVMAAAEPLFDPATDAWFDLDFDPASRHVAVTPRPFERKGDVGRWLVSEAFDLQSPRSIEAERVLDEAAVALSKDDIKRDEALAIDHRLRSVLGETDSFWIRWRYVAEKRGWLE